jgi:hypothetical protein
MTEPTNHLAPSQQDRVAAETLIRTSVLALANGASVADIDEIVRRNASNVSHADVQAGRLNTTIIGDIINTVEQAKGSKPFNWSAATEAQIKAYLSANGINFRDHGQHGFTILGKEKDSSLNNAESGTNRTAAAENASIDAHNYPGSPFAKAGLSFDTFASLRAQGFSDSNIVHAAQDSRSNGFDPNNKKVAGAFAVLDKDDGKRRDERNRLLKEFDHRLEHDEEFQRLKAERDKAQGEQRSALEQQMIARGREVSKDSGLRGHFDAAPTPAARDAGTAIEGEKIKLKGAIGEYSRGNRVKAEAVNGTLTDIRLNPDDAKVRQNYAALKREALHDPRKKQALAKMEKALGNGEKIVAEKQRENSNRASDITEKKQEVAALQPEKHDAFADLLAMAPQQRASADSDTPPKDKENPSAQKPQSHEQLKASGANKDEKKDAKADQPKAGGGAAIKPKTRLAGSLNPSA